MLAPLEEAEERRTLGRFSGVRDREEVPTYLQARLLQVGQASCWKIGALWEFSPLNQNMDILRKGFILFLISDKKQEEQIKYQLPHTPAPFSYL